MKLISTTLFLLIFSMQLSAQITLNNDNVIHSPSHEDILNTKLFPNINMDIEGENMNYDFSSLELENSIVDNYAPATRPGFTDFTRFSIGFSFFGPLYFESEYYTQLTPEGIVYVGSYKIEEIVALTSLTGNPADHLSFPGSSEIFEEPVYTIKFPATYQDSWTGYNTFRTDFTTSIAAAGLSNTPSLLVQHNTYENEVVGWGQLKIPTAYGPSIPYDVIVVKEVTTSIDSIFLGGAPASNVLLNSLGLSQGSTSIERTYLFYTEGHELPLLRLCMSPDWQTIDYCLYPTTDIRSHLTPTFVDIDAIGNNDGSSWEDAYTDLNSAINNASINDEIWVAEGVYTPTVPTVSPDTTKKMFLLWQDLNIYGGFNGTETTRSERQPNNYVTILSGDLDGDDIINDIINNKGDNVDNVVFGFNSITNSCVLDGFTISGGQADGDASVHSNVRGAGMYTLGPLQISNCTFSQNFALNHGGGAYFYEADASGGRVINCNFDGNGAGMNGGGLFAAFLINNPIEIDSCNFMNNIAGDTGGGFISVRSGVTMSNSTFANNTAQIGSGGGASYSNVLNLQLSNTDFMNNNSGSHAGGADVTLITPNQNATIENCNFFDNIAAGSAGGLYCQSSELNNNFIVKNCIIDGNSAGTGLATGGGMDVLYGGSAQGGNALIENCQITHNSIQSAGGGISLRNQAGDNNITLRNCQVENNTAGLNAGGLLHYKATENNGIIEITHCSFKNNTSQEALAMGLLSLTPKNENINVKMSNCLFTDHSGSNNTTSNIVAQSITADITNCTITGNTSGIIAKDNSIVNLSNTILHTPSYSTIVDAALNQFVSSGGNIFSDDISSTWSRAEDQLNGDPLFQNGTTILSENSSAIDRGIMPTEVSEFDLNGDDRIQGSCIDIGTYESPYDAGISCLTVSVDNSNILPSSVIIFPNPISDNANIKIDNEWRGILYLSIFDVLGNNITNKKIEKNSESIKIQLDIMNLKNGTYILNITNGKQNALNKFIVMK